MIVGIETNRRVLSVVSEPLVLEEENLSILFTQLQTALENSKVPGVGLAAIQVGIPKRAAVIRFGDTVIDLWNPEISEAHGELLSPEGCLSLPGVHRTVRRYREIILKNGDGKSYALEGFEAIVVQHEIDHMNGITIADKDHRALQIGRNEPCPCGSGVKFKKCHIEKETELQSKLIENPVG